MNILNNRVYINVRISMNDCAKIIEMAGENNGMVTASSVSKAGLQRRALAECVTAGRLSKGARCG